MKRSEQYKIKMQEERERRCSVIMSKLEELNINKKLMAKLYFELDSDLDLLNDGIRFFSEELSGDDLAEVIYLFVKKRKAKIEENIKKSHACHISNIIGDKAK